MNLFGNIIGLKTFIEFALAVIFTPASVCLVYFSKPLKDSKREEDRLFRKLCFSALFYSLFTILKYCHKIFKFFPFYMLPAHLILYIPDIVLLYMVFLWVLFVDAATGYGEKKLKKRCRVFYIHLFLMTLMIFTGYFLLLKVQETFVLTGSYSGEADSNFVIWMYVYYVIALSIIISYLISAFSTVHRFHKEKTVPLFLRLDVFIIPWIIAIIIQHLPGNLLLDIPCAVISLFLTYLSMRRRYRYMDLETGFYKEEFLRFFEEFEEKKNIGEGCAVYFYSGKDGALLSEAISENKPENCIAIHMNDGGFILIGGMFVDSAVSYNIRIIEEALKEKDKDAEVSSRFWLKPKEESGKEFSSRVLGAISRKEKGDRDPVYSRISQSEKEDRQV